MFNTKHVAYADKLKQNGSSQAQIVEELQKSPNSLTAEDAQWCATVVFNSPAQTPMFKSPHPFFMEYINMDGSKTMVLTSNAWRDIENTCKSYYFSIRGKKFSIQLRGQYNAQDSAGAYVTKEDYINAYTYLKDNITSRYELDPTLFDQAWENYFKADRGIAMMQEAVLMNEYYNDEYYGISKGRRLFWYILIGLALFGIAFFWIFITNS